MNEETLQDAGPGTDSAEAVLGHTFVSTAVLEGGVRRELVAGTRIRLAFADDQIDAHAGCNRMQFPTWFDGAQLVVTEGPATLIGCMPERHEQDQWLSAFLLAQPSWTSTGAELTLTAASTTIVLARVT